MKRTRQTFEKSVEEEIEAVKIDKPVPVWIPPSVVFSTRDKAPELELSHDQLICYSKSTIQTIGFRTARTTYGILHNIAIHSNRALKFIAPYIWECEILKCENSSKSNVRLGMNLPA